MTDLTEVVAVTLAARDGYANGLSVATRDWYMNSAAAVLDAVADDLRAEGFARALDEVSASYAIPIPDNPYRKESRNE